MDKDRVAAREAVAQMTKSEKLSHFWGYYKWYVAGAIFALLLATMLACDIIGGTEPDLTILYVSETAVPSENLRELEAYFAEILTNANNGEPATVSIIQIVVDPNNITTDRDVAAIQSFQVQFVSGAAKLFIASPTFLERMQQFDGGYSVIEYYAPLANPRVAELMWANEERPLFAAVRIVYPREREGRNSEQTLQRHQNARMIYEVIIN